jgi:hypothetical protein
MRIDPAHPDPARIGLEQGGNDRHQGRLAGTVGSQQSDDLTGRYLHVYSREGDDGSVALV